MMRWRFASPGGGAVVEMTLDDVGRLSCSARREGSPVLLVRLGLERSDATFDAGLVLAAPPVAGLVDERYELPHGKRRHLRDHATTATLALDNPGGERLEVDVRVYDGAVAWRYRFPGPGSGARSVLRELTAVTLADEGRAWLQPVSPQGGPAHAHDNLYVDGVPIGTASPSHAWDLPAAFEAGSSWLLVGEADVDGEFQGSRLAGAPDGRCYTFVGPDPWEGQGRGSAIPSSTLPWTLPWRFAVLADSAAELLESTVMTDLARPSRLSDTSWVRPGRASWSRWSDVSSPRDLRVLRRYVDLAAEMGWEYSLVDAGWPVHPDREMRRLVGYAAERGVGLWLWYNSGGPHSDGPGEPRNLMHERAARRRELARVAAWGVVGITVDFFYSDKQDGMARYLGILEDAADAHVMVSFRGCTVPRGWERTWPHLMTMEAVRGAEWYLVNLAFADDAVWHNTVLPFTRNAVGPMDYAPVTFSDTFRPHRTTTAHELALAVVYESGVVRFPDSVQSYRSQHPAVIDVLRAVPAAWDDVVGLDGEPGDRVVLARRAGETWWLAGINGRTATQETELDLRRLDRPRGRWLLVHDGPGRDDVVVRDVDAGARFIAPAMPAGGGFVARLLAS
ncbi:MAG TPA: glycoside hydrolase family 97 catalytic domain-containing protein [Propionicimonas sp.]|jgi:hypothetical protein